MREDIPVLWLVEHVAREFDVACATAAWLEGKYGIRPVIRNIYFDYDEILTKYKPKVIIYPFYYCCKKSTVLPQLFEIYRGSTHFNLAWEELHYSAYEKVKAPADDITKNRVIHHAWGKFYKDYLTKNGVAGNHVIVNGNPAYQLYKDPYRKYYGSKINLAHRYNLRPQSRWIFVPENYRWAFLGTKARAYQKSGGSVKVIAEIAEYSKKALALLLRWCNNFAMRRPECTVIFRTRPSTMQRDMDDFFRQNEKIQASNLRFIRDGSVREWILASDVTLSSYSTSLIEASIAERPAYMVEPIGLPDGLKCDWYKLIRCLRTYKEFESACLCGRDIPTNLNQWATKEMLANGDPIEGLVDIVHDLVAQNGNQIVCPKRVTYPKLYLDREGKIADKFDKVDVRNAIDRWSSVLLGNNVVDINATQISHGSRGAETRKETSTK
jgi:surface carbohydrate biosynthesis protein